MTKARELRFAFVFDDYDATLQLFREVFGLEALAHFDHGGGRGVMLRVPSATLELFDRAYARHVDDVEVGGPADDKGPAEGRARIAVNVENLAEASAAAEAAGATPVAAPVDTPGGGHNQRLRIDGGFQLTLFQSSPR